MRSAPVDRRRPARPKWEPEPARWIGITSMYGLFGVADTQEERANAERTAPIARFAAKITGMD